MHWPTDQPAEHHIDPRLSYYMNFSLNLLLNLAEEGVLKNFCDLQTDQLTSIITKNGIKYALIHT